MTEREWQTQVLQLAELCGWRTMHVYPLAGARGRHRTPTTCRGWPDLFLWHPRDRRTMALELKVGRNTVTDDQRDVLISLEAAGVECHIAYPDDLDALADILRRRPTPARRDPRPEPISRRG